MSLSISSLANQAASIAAATTTTAPAAAAGKPGEFASMLAGAVQRVDQYRTDAGQAVDSLISGESGELHSVALAAQRAELAFELGLQVRNKVVQAYQEIMRMQL
jgi:flagellar hook-basal body complex protein FliE